MSSAMYLLLIVVYVCLDVVIGADWQTSSRITVNPNIMWIAAVASGLGVLATAIVALIISTIVLRRYERKRLMLLAPMLAGLQSPNDNDDSHHQLTSSGSTPSATTQSVNSDRIHHSGALTVNAGSQPLGGVAHVYYNRGLDVEAESTDPLDPRPIELVENRRPSSGYEISVL